VMMMTMTIMIMGVYSNSRNLRRLFSPLGYVQLNSEIYLIVI
jgi:hypothetical protein